jgi:hypothetical protein
MVVNNAVAMQDDLRRAGRRDQHPNFCPINANSILRTVGIRHVGLKACATGTRLRLYSNRAGLIFTLGFAALE